MQPLGLIFETAAALEAFKKVWTSFKPQAMLGATETAWTGFRPPFSASSFRGHIGTQEVLLTAYPTELGRNEVDWALFVAAFISSFKPRGLLLVGTAAGAVLGKVLVGTMVGRLPEAAGLLKTAAAEESSPARQLLLHLTKPVSFIKDDDHVTKETSRFVYLFSSTEADTTTTLAQAAALRSGDLNKVGTDRNSYAFVRACSFLAPADGTDLLALVIKGVDCVDGSAFELAPNGLNNTRSALNIAAWNDWKLGGDRSAGNAAAWAKATQYAGQAAAAFAFDFVSRLDPDPAPTGLSSAAKKEVPAAGGIRVGGIFGNSAVADVMRGPVTFGAQNNGPAATTAPSLVPANTAVSTKAAAGSPSDPASVEVGNVYGNIALAREIQGPVAFGPQNNVS